MELLFVVDTTRLLVAAPLFLNKQSVASQPARVKLLVSDDETSYGLRSVAGEAPENHANPHYLNDATCHEGRGDGQASAASHLFLLFSR